MLSVVQASTAQSLQSPPFSPFHGPSLPPAALTQSFSLGAPQPQKAAVPVAGMRSTHFPPSHGYFAPGYAEQPPFTTSFFGGRTNDRHRRSFFPPPPLHQGRAAWPDQPEAERHGTGSSAYPHGQGGGSGQSGPHFASGSGAPYFGPGAQPPVHSASHPHLAQGFHPQTHAHSQAQGPREWGHGMHLAPADDPNQHTFAAFGVSPGRKKPRGKRRARQTVPPPQNEPMPPDFPEPVSASSVHVS